MGSDGHEQHRGGIVTGRGSPFADREDALACLRETLGWYASWGFTPDDVRAALEAVAPPASERL